MKVNLSKPAQIFRQKTNPRHFASFSGRGFTLVEVLVATAVVAISGVAILSTVTAFLKVSLIAQDTVRAQSLANEKMETLKNMPYDDLATQNGAIYPPGNIPDTETVTSGGRTYIVRTDIRFVDDPFDGLSEGTIPVDFYPSDYKKATISVSDKNDTRILVGLSTNIAANAAETSDGTGILAIQIVDSIGDPVPNANIHLTNPNPSPPVDIDTYTDINGKLQIPVLPEDTSNGYHLESTLPGYSTAWTNTDDQAGYEPEAPTDFNIIAQQVTNVTLAIDLVSTMNISVVDETGGAVSSLEVTVSGDKITHKNPSDSTDVIRKFSNPFTTNPSGQITISNLEWDSYGFSVPSGYYVISTTPYQTVAVPADSTVDVTLKVTTDSGWPRVDQVTPITGINNSVVLVEVLGVNLPLDSTMELKKSGESTITATGVVSSDGDTRLNGSFDLNGAATGTWDLVVTIPGGKSTTQTDGFTISAP